MRRTLRALLLPLVVVGLLAACGGDDGGSTTDAADTPASTAGTADGKATATSVADGAATTTSMDLGSGGGEFCDKARAQLAGGLDPSNPMVQSLVAGLMNPSTSEETKAKVREYVEANKALAQDAPAEIQKPMQTTLAATETIFAALEQANFDITKIDISKITSIMSDPEFTAAAKELETYFKEQCGFDISTVGSTPTTGR